MEEHGLLMIYVLDMVILPIEYVKLPKGLGFSFETLSMNDGTSNQQSMVRFFLVGYPRLGVRRAVNLSKSFGQGGTQKFSALKTWEHEL